MATYLQDGVGYFPDENLFTPDYNIIIQSLQQRQNRYDKGFSKWKNVRNSVVNSKVSNDENEEVKNQYIQSFENSLKDLPSIDLSIDSNVATATSVFQPFFDDKELVRDITLTKIAGDELSKGQSMLMSSDPKQRAMHSAISDEYVGITIDELKRSKRGDGSMMNIKPRYYVPSVNLGEKFKDFLTSKNLSLVSETRDGKGAIFSMGNGKMIEMPLRSLFDGLVTGDERKYFDAWGDVLYNRQINQQMGQGLSLTDAKKTIAVDLATQTKQYYDDDLKSNMDAYTRSLTQWEDYKKQHTVDGKILETEDAYTLKNNVMFYQDQVNKLKNDVAQFDLNKVTDEYLNQGSNYWSSRLYNDSLTKIVRGYAALNASSTVKSDDAFWKWKEIEQKELDRQNARDIAQMRTSGISGGLGGATLSIGPDGELVIVPGQTGSKKSPADKTKEEVAMEEANAKDYMGLQNVPAPTNQSYVDILYDTRNKTEKLIASSKLTFTEKALRTEFPEVSKFFQQVIKEQEENGQPRSASSVPGNAGQWTDRGLNVIGKDISKFLPYSVDAFKNSVEKDPSKDIPAVTQREKAVKSFMQSSGKEFREYITNKDIEPTYAAMVDFLYEKARTSYISRKENMSNSERNDFSETLHVIDKGLTVLDQFNKDVSTISNELLNPDKKIVQPLMVTKNERGDWRFKTKEEVEENYKYYSQEVGRTAAKGSPYREYYEPSVPILRDAGLAKQYLELMQAYDKNIESFNKTVAMPSSLKFTNDMFKLKQYGVYEIGSSPDVKGEDAEKAIGQLLYIANNDYMEGTDKRTPLEKSVDETIFEGLDRSGVKVAISNLVNSISTSDKQHRIQYLQYTGIPGDERQGFVIRFNDEYINSRISQIKSVEGRTGKEIREDDSTIAALRAIQQNGLKIFAGQEKGIAGSLAGEYNVFERALQEDMNYSSPEFDKDRMQYNIRKLTDNTYELSGKYYIKDLDEKGNVVTKEISLASGNEQVVRFPFKSSFTSIIKTTNDWIAYQLDQAQKMYENKVKTLPKAKVVNTVTEDDLEKKIRMSKGQ